MIEPSLWERDNPEYWHSRKAVKWVDENGNTHKTFVTPIKYLKTGHLVKILLKNTNTQPDKVLLAQINNVRREYEVRQQRASQGENNSDKEGHCSIMETRI